MSEDGKYPDWIKAVEDIMQMNSRICAMQPGVAAHFGTGVYFLVEDLTAGISAMPNSLNFFTTSLK